MHVPLWQKPAHKGLEGMGERGVGRHSELWNGLPMDCQRRTMSLSRQETARWQERPLHTLTVGGAVLGTAERSGTVVALPARIAAARPVLAAYALQRAVARAERGRRSRDEQVDKAHSRTIISRQTVRSCQSLVRGGESTERHSIRRVRGDLWASATRVSCGVVVAPSNSHVD